MVGLFGNDLAYGEDFHITNDEHVTWNMTIDALEEALGLKAIRTDVPREYLYEKLPEYKPVVEGDKGRIMRFDSSKIRAAVPSFSCEIKLADGIADMIEFYEGHPELKRIDWVWMGKMDRLLLGKKEARSARALYDFHTFENAIHIRLLWRARQYSQLGKKGIRALGVDMTSLKFIRSHSTIAGCSALIAIACWFPPIRSDLIWAVV